MPRGIDEGDLAVLDPIEPPAIGPAAGYDQADLARDLGIEPGDRALPRAVSAYADAFTGSFWQERRPWTGCDRNQPGQIRWGAACPAWTTTLPAVITSYAAAFAGYWARSSRPPAPPGVPASAPTRPAPPRPPSPGPPTAPAGPGPARAA